MVQLSPYFEYLDQLPAWLTIYMVAIIAINLIIIMLLATGKSIKDFLYFQKYGNPSVPDDTLRSIQSRISENQINQNTKPCPLCGGQITSEQAFCHICGGNISEKEEEEIKKALFEKYGQGGIETFLQDEGISKEAAMYCRVYGKGACLSFLNEKAKEVGLNEVNITDADIDKMLAFRKENEEKALSEKYKDGGVASLLRDEDIAKEAAMYRRIYGKSACISFVKTKAKEMGLDETEITDESIDTFLAYGHEMD